MKILYSNFLTQETFSDKENPSNPLIHLKEQQKISEVELSIKNTSKTMRIDELFLCIIITYYLDILSIDFYMN